MNVTLTQLKGLPVIPETWGFRAPVAIVMITHETSQASVERALKAIAASDKVRARPCMIPMEAA